jgi:hypothetical protein
VENEVTRRRSPGIAEALKRIRDLALWGRVQFTYKARRELAELRLAKADACEVISDLTPQHFVGRLVSEHTDEWLYVFRIEIVELQVYAKLILRDECVVVSFHEESAPDASQEQG